MKRRASGLQYWMWRVLKEHSRACAYLTTETVHDVRVSIRRCTTIARALSKKRPIGLWNKLTDELRPLFKSLGDFRDTQVATEWVEIFSSDGDPARKKILTYLEACRKPEKKIAAKAIAGFDRKLWKKRLVKAAEEFRKKPFRRDELMEVTADHCREAHALHCRAVKAKKEDAWHDLRVALKRFRYAVDNLLPARYHPLSSEIKKAQDFLGESRDFWLLRRRLREVRPALSGKALRWWDKRLSAERRKRLEGYLAMSSGRPNVWSRWAKALKVKKIPAKR